MQPHRSCVVIDTFCHSNRCSSECFFFTTLCVNNRKYIFIQKKKRIARQRRGPSGECTRVSLTFNLMLGVEKDCGYYLADFLRRNVGIGKTRQFLV